MDIVKYHNFMNELSLGSFKAVELDLLMALCSQFKEKGTNELEFSFASIKKLVSIEGRLSNAEILSLLKGINKKLLNLDIMVETETEIIQFVLFTDFTIDKSCTYYKVGVHPKFSYILNDLARDFTVFELQEFVKLRSKYSKNLYRLLKQFESTRWRRFKAEDLKEKMGCPSSYTTKRFNAEILKPSIEELTPLFTDLTCDTDKMGKKITTYDFRWKQAVNDALPGQVSFSTLEDFAEIVEGLKDSEKREALKIANDIIKSKAKSKEKGKPKPKHNFEGRKYVFDETGNLLIGEEKDGR